MGKKRKIPYIFRNKQSCPNCGFVPNELQNQERYLINGYSTCPRCNERFSSEEFWEENQFKWRRDMDEEFFVNED